MRPETQLMIGGYWSEHLVSACLCRSSVSMVIPKRVLAQCVLAGLVMITICVLGEAVPFVAGC